MDRNIRYKRVSDIIYEQLDLLLAKSREPLITAEELYKTSTAIDCLVETLRQMQ